jgi:hypothetical protein
MAHRTGRIEFRICAKRDIGDRLRTGRSVVAGLSCRVVEWCFDDFEARLTKKPSMRMDTTYYDFERIFILPTDVHRQRKAATPPHNNTTTHPPCAQLRAKLVDFFFYYSFV